MIYGYCDSKHQHYYICTPEKVCCPLISLSNWIDQGHAEGLSPQETKLYILKWYRIKQWKVREWRSIPAFILPWPRKKLTPLPKCIVISFSCMFEWGLFLDGKFLQTGQLSQSSFWWLNDVIMMHCLLHVYWKSCLVSFSYLISKCFLRIT